MLNLNLARPLACIDLEATGQDPETARIVEIAIVRQYPDGTRDRWSSLVHPREPIPEESTKVHGIADVDVVNAPSFAELAPVVAERLAGCDLCGYNGRGYDVPLLRAEYARVRAPWPCEGARFVDPFVIFRERVPHNLASAVSLYTGRSHEGAHRALADAEATLDVLEGQLAQYTDLPRDVGELDAVSGGRRPDWATELGHLRWRDDGELVVSFGKHNGRLLWDMDWGYLGWLQRQSFPADVKAFAGQVLRNIRPRDPRLSPREPEPAPVESAFEECDDIPF